MMRVPIEQNHAAQPHLRVAMINEAIRLPKRNESRSEVPSTREERYAQGRSRDLLHIRNTFLCLQRDGFN